jgi:FkbM family methyltransferase
VAICSYAQNREDVLIARALPARTGFYIDVGAADPLEHSVTKYFYDLGWSGLNIEPQPGFVERLTADRPRDRTLAMVLSDQPGSLVVHAAPTHPGWATTDASVAATMREHGIALFPYEVPARTLADICAEYAPNQIDFLKIDVEGAEQKVLAGGDFTRWRPRIVLIEATEQGSPRPNHESWEPLILENDYLYATFDGLNRYYVRQEDAHLVPILQVPVNVFDDWYPYEYVRKIVDLEAAVAEERRLSQQLARKVDQQAQTIEAIRTRLLALKRDIGRSVAR